jgi:hypothetical protein
MKSDKLNRWLTLGANFGVVIGLLLLVLEYRESQNMAETEAAVRRLNQIQEAFVEMAVSETLPVIKVKAMTEGVQSLTDVELYRLQTWEASVRRRMWSQYIEYSRGYLDEATAETMLRAAAELLPYWEELGYELGDNQFEQAIRIAAGR